MLPDSATIRMKGIAATSCRNARCRRRKARLRASRRRRSATRSSRPAGKKNPSRILDGCLQRARCRCRPQNLATASGSDSISVWRS